MHKHTPHQNANTAACTCNNFWDCCRLTSPSWVRRAKPPPLGCLMVLLTVMESPYSSCLNPCSLLSRVTSRTASPFHPCLVHTKRKNGVRQRSIMPKMIVKRGRYKYFGVDTMGKYGWLPRYYGGTVPLYLVESCANDRVGHSAFTFRLLPYNSIQ